MVGKSRSQRTRVIVEASLSIALAAVLHFVSVWQMPQGGDISLSMLPLFIFAIRRGPMAGMACGALYGVVDLMLKSDVVHPVQLVLDYPLAFGLCGLAGVLAGRWHALAADGRLMAGVATAVVPGLVLGALGRYGAHVLSGVVFWSSFAPEGQPVLVYSLVYNAFVWVSAAACLLPTVAIIVPLERVVPIGGAR